jgi:clan AA aspartic protease (TIGR02281 family)
MRWLSDFRRVHAAELARLTAGRAGRPAPIPSAGGHGTVATVSADDNGQFFVLGMVNGVATFSFLVDTGAAFTTFGKRDAERLGFDTSALVYEQWFMTASGWDSGALVELDELVIGNGRWPHVIAVIGSNFGDIEPVLGMDVLREMEMTVVQDTMTLRDGSGATRR